MGWGEAQGVPIFAFFSAGFLSIVLTSTYDNQQINSTKGWTGHAIIGAWNLQHSVKLFALSWLVAWLLSSSSSAGASALLILTISNHDIRNNRARNAQY